ncbi:MAG: PAS domain S-box protein [Candidatus Bathyarchaeota archaeon]|nr:PAS domain S-box protein [Candidatus Bathyarchaeota archaeon]
MLDLAVDFAADFCLEDAEAKSVFHARLLNAVGQAIVATDANGQITFWNSAAEGLFGRKEDEMLGKEATGFLAEVLPRLDSGARNCLKLGKPWTGEFAVKCRDSSYRAVILSCSPFFDDDGKLAGSIGVITDITEEKWMQDALIETIQKIEDLNDKMRVVESLTRHDVRNKLGALNGRLYLLKKKVAGDAGLLGELAEIELISKQILNILDFAQVYVQVGSEELIDVDVERSVAEAAKLFSSLNHAQLVNSCRGLTVVADSLLRQLFYNLIDNTLKYGEKVGEIRVRFEEEPTQLRLIYEDDGVGLSNDTKLKIFSEGYGKGTGYGLYLIKRICEAYGWVIQEEGIPREGARFVMTIPKISKEGKTSYQITSSI